MPNIPDHIAPGLRILFVGYNPSIRSGETGHHYANPRNRFWTILHRAGLTPRLYKADEDGSLLELGYGFTNIVARPTRTAAEITAKEYAEGREALRRKIEKYRPRIVCFVGKGVYEAYSGRRDVAWGFQAEPVVPGVREFVAPSSSGLVRMKLDEIVHIYLQMNDPEQNS
ncbi:MULTISPECIES: mismatch-specific DNA-glycosylase [unclassified Paenibacillus]|uniref:mismatch-specific DNA-glycosylase n=1 Tax=unclassified Paenibacillus TaxID=185978 RepID=UPI001C0F867D|nr:MULTISPECIES: mismatch-specific DNA-glycosylase [unclassified Paenibacillus]MBU5441303.1 mismatch-specific DNA-glycosylase [Paenibacillus sp. MSJ-34]CAH0120869.1 G/U mismatch-specific DNA glycosylase [Paenibacillus sp. CECT 9249]